jgi:hypothetical protein
VPLSLPQVSSYPQQVTQPPLLFVDALHAPDQLGALRLHFDITTATTEAEAFTLY